jgi:hypothetical protein
LEAFLVVTYVNSYDKWFLECIGNHVSDSPQEESGEEEQSVQISSLTHTTTDTRHPPVAAANTVTPLVTKRYTANAMGGGKFKGWNEEGLELYQKVAEVLKEQRQDKSDPCLAGFDKKLLERFRSEGRPTAGHCMTKQLPEFDEIDEFFPSEYDDDEEDDVSDCNMLIEKV